MKKVTNNFLSISIQTFLKKGMKIFGVARRCKLVQSANFVHKTEQLKGINRNEGISV
jgi:hypothetical protein